jgi:hypothetical protein
MHRHRPRGGVHWARPHRDIGASDPLPEPRGLPVTRNSGPVISVGKVSTFVSPRDCQTTYKGRVRDVCE